MPEQSTRTHLDGNAIAGTLHTLLGREMTEAIRRCAYCPTVAPLAELDLYADAPGLVLRCRGCGAVALRIVERPDRVVIDLAGTAVLELPAASGRHDPQARRAPPGTAADASAEA